MKVQRRGANAPVTFIPETRNYASAIKNDNPARDNRGHVISRFWGKCGRPCIFRTRRETATKEVRLC